VPAEPQTVYISIDQLRVGIYIKLELSWFEHPFSVNSFKIKNDEQIQTIRSLGLKKVLCIPEKSDRSSLTAKPPEKLKEEPAEAKAVDAASVAKQERIARINKERVRIRECEKKYLAAATAIANINKNLFSRPKEALKEANFLILEMVESLMTDKSVAIHLMNAKVGGEEIYHHSLNVAVLAMMLAKEQAIPKEDIQTLGLGILFHDIGKTRIPDKILRKLDPLTDSERKFFQLHPTYGVEIATELGLAPEVIEIIAHHHETNDGTGYPEGLTGVTTLSKITCIVNTYDNLCNHLDVRKSLTPNEALSLMFTQQKEQYDSTLLQLFIKCLGVYPPGTAVQLSNDAIGMVISVSTTNPLRPNVLIYDESIPKKEAIILAMEEEPDLKIVKSIRPGSLSRDIFDYLSLRNRVTFYFDSGPERKAK
jgi:putative nucleotidyltransferase with HDIG domain